MYSCYGKAEFSAAITPALHVSQYPSEVNIENTNKLFHIFFHVKINLNW